MNNLLLNSNPVAMLKQMQQRQQIQQRKFLPAGFVIPELSKDNITLKSYILLDAIKTQPDMDVSAFLQMMRCWLVTARLLTLYGGNKIKETVAQVMYQYKQIQEPFDKAIHNKDAAGALVATADIRLGGFTSELWQDTERMIKTLEKLLPTILPKDFHQTVAVINDIYTQGNVWWMTMSPEEYERCLGIENALRLQREADIQRSLNTMDPAHADYVNAVANALT